MQKLCTRCSQPFECAASPECWCQRVAAWQAVRQEHPDCLCKMNL